MKPDRNLWHCKHGHNGYEHPVCYLKEIPQQIGYLDIETSGLQADFAFVFSWVIKYKSQNKFEKYVLQKSDYDSGVQRDKEAIRKLIMALHNFDIIVTYYGKDRQFDVPFLRSRTLYYGFQFLPYGSMIHIDLYQVAKGKLRIHSNRLESVADLLDIRMKKTKIETGIWNRASMGYDVKALKYIEEHNMKDAIILEEVHELLEPYFPMRKTSI